MCTCRALVVHIHVLLYMNTKQSTHTHTHTPPNEEVLHDDGQEVRRDVPLVNFIHDNVRCLCQSSTHIHTLGLIFARMQL